MIVKSNALPSLVHIRALGTSRKFYLNFIRSEFEDEPPSHGMAQGVNYFICDSGPSTDNVLNCDDLSATHLQSCISRGHEGLMSNI